MAEQGKVERVANIMSAVREEGSERPRNSDSHRSFSYVDVRAIYSRQEQTRAVCLVNCPHLPLISSLPTRADVFAMAGPKYLSGDAAAIDAFLDKFDVRLRVHPW